MAGGAVVVFFIEASAAMIAGYFLSAHAVYIMDLLKMIYFWNRIFLARVKVTGMK